MERHTHKIISVDFNHFENTEVNRLWKKRSKRSAVATDTTLMAQMGHISRKTRQRPAHRMSEVTSDLLEALNRTVRPKKKTVAPPTAQQHRRGVKVSVSLVRSNDAKRLSQKLTTSFTQPRYNPARSAVGGGANADAPTGAPSSAVTNCRRSHKFLNRKWIARKKEERKLKVSEIRAGYCECLQETSSDGNLTGPRCGC